MKRTHVGIAISTLLLAGAAVAQGPVITELGSGCGGVGGLPHYTSPTLPIPGANLVLHVEHMRPQALGGLMVGWAGQLTPVPLDYLLMTGCELHVRPDFFYTFDTDTGARTWNLMIPPVASLIGQSAWSQVFFDQPSANPAGVAASNGLRLTFGNPAAGPQMVSSIQQWGITWQFDHDYPAGQFVNGDWWVVGPVTIVGISPGTQDLNGRIINGSMVNPDTSGMHGYDSTLYGQYASPQRHYEASLNAAIDVSTGSPLVLQPSSSLISTISQIGPAANGSPSAIKTAAVLTVLATVPPADAFRPPYSGTNKTIRWRESQLDYGALATLTPAAGAPSLSSITSQMSRVWLDHCAHWTSGQMHPVDNMPSYYRDHTSLTGTAGLLLNCNFSNAQKRDLLVRFVQLGIDYFGNIEAGARWGVNGHCNGRKFPILFAGRVLNDPTLLGVGTQYATNFYGPNNPANNFPTFSEDGQTFYVAQTSPGVYNWGYGGYTATEVGMPEWGNFHAEGGTQGISSDSVGWDTNGYRRCCSANGWVGSCLTMRAMGLQSAWNQQAWFDYMDRYIQIEPDGDWREAWEPWHGTMWHTYRAQL